MSNETLNPLFSDQWYLKNTGQRGAPGIDINVVPVWTNYTGRGVIVAVNDDGMDLTHPDLVANILTNLVFDTPNGTTGQGFAKAASSHGTVVGSIIAMANNTEGGVGVAYDAKLVPALAFGGEASALFLANLASGAAVSCNSWGSDPAFAENFSSNGSPSDQAWGVAMLRCVTEARNGLGMVIEVSGGNERANQADTALSNFTGARYTIAVGAVDNLGKVTAYSTAGASLLVCAPGGVGETVQSVNTGYGIVSADITGAAGYNTTAGAAGNYAYQNQGTSYSGPMVAGVAALMLQANPKLGFRDVSTILAMTARQNDSASGSWVATSGSDWNLGGMHFSRDFGFGLIDATAAVHLAESWNLPAGTVANWKSADAVAGLATSVIPENTTGLTVAANMAQNLSIERVEVLLDLGMTAPSQLRATLSSPAGTTITLFDQPLNRPLKDGSPDMSAAESAWPGVFTIGATAFLGEKSAGTWTLKLFDTVTGIEATYKSATVRAWGADITPDNNLVFTNEYVGSKQLVDTSGIDTLNAAALSSPVTLDLREGAKSTVGVGDFTIATGSLIENAIGGDGADVITGNSANNVLRGNRGNDTLIGGGGTDTAVYTDGLAGYSVTKTGSTYSVHAKTGSDGTDTVSGIESLRFADKSVNLGIQAKAAAASAADVQRLTELYVAFFNRVPDANGLEYWIGQLAGQSTNQIADSFYNAGVQYSELTGFSASMTNDDFVRVIYKNVLGRSGDTAPPDKDVAYWVNNLATGTDSRGSLINTILGAAYTFKGDATWGWVPVLLANKLSVASTFAISYGLNYPTPAEDLSHGMAIAKAVTATDTAAALALIGVSAADLHLV